MTACALRYSRIRFRSSTVLALSFLIVFFFNDTATTEIYTLSLHDALPISRRSRAPSDGRRRVQCRSRGRRPIVRSEEHTSELQSQSNLVCRLLLEKKKKIKLIWMQMTSLRMCVEHIPLRAQHCSARHSETR